MPVKTVGRSAAATSQKKTFEEELIEHGCIVFTNKGKSMMPMLREDRDLMVIQRRMLNEDGSLLRCKKYDAVLYKRGDKYVLHRILKVLSEGYVICGDHNYRREYDIREEQILGVLTAFVRDGKEISVTDKRYLCYVHLWCDFFYIRAFLLRLKILIGQLKGKLKQKYAHVKKQAED